jgi:hypothetical protein
VFAHGPLEDQVQEYNNFMDGCVAQELKDYTGNLFFNSNSLAASVRTLEGLSRLGCLGCAIEAEVVQQ